MKYKFLYLLIFISFSSCYNIERNCKDFKTGTFYSEVIIGDTTYKSNFTRNDTLQVETYDGKIDSSSIRWVNDCEVIYRTINPKNRAERKDVHLKILTTTDSSYTFEYSYVGDNNKQKGIAYKREPLTIVKQNQLSQGRFYHTKDSLSEIEIKDNNIKFIYNKAFDKSDIYSYKITEIFNELKNSTDQHLLITNTQDTMEYYLEGNSKNNITMIYQPNGKFHFYQRKQ